MLFAVTPAILPDLQVEVIVLAHGVVESKKPVLLPVHNRIRGVNCPAVYDESKSLNRVTEKACKKVAGAQESA